MDLGYKPSRVCCALPAFFDSCSMSAVEKEVAPVKMVTADTDSASMGPGSKPEKPAIDKPREVRPALRAPFLSRLGATPWVFSSQF